LGNLFKAVNSTKYTLGGATVRASLPSLAHISRRTTQ